MFWTSQRKAKKGIATSNKGHSTSGKPPSSVGRRMKRQPARCSAIAPAGFNVFGAGGITLPSQRSLNLQLRPKWPRTLSRLCVRSPIQSLIFRDSWPRARHWFGQLMGSLSSWYHDLGPQILRHVLQCSSATLELPSWSHGSKSRLEKVQGSCTISAGTMKKYRVYGTQVARLDYTSVDPKQSNVQK